MINDLKTKPMEILLVEDGLTDAKMTTFAVRRSQVHHRLTLMRTLNDALRFLERQSIYAQAPRPDLILLDLMLPDGSGLEIFGRRQSAGESASPHSCRLDGVQRRVAKGSLPNDGSSRFHEKPVHEREFMRVIRDHKKLMIHSTPLLSRPTF